MARGSRRRGVSPPARPPKQSLLIAQAAFVPVILAIVWYLVTKETRLDPMSLPSSLRLFFTTGSSGLTRIDPVYLPPPEAVYNSAIELSDILPGALWISMRIVLLGLAIGGAAGIATGLILGYSPTIRRYFEATLDNLVRPVPFIAFIYLFILWFRVEAVRLVVLVAIGIFLLLSLTTLEAVRNVPQIYVKAALTAGAERFRIYRTVVVPAITPHLIASVRLGAAYAWGLLVAAELAGSQQGLGYILISRVNFYLDTASAVLIVFIFCSLAVVFDQSVRYAAGRLTRWSPRARRGMVGHMLGN